MPQKKPTPESSREPLPDAPAPESGSREQAIRQAAYEAYQRRGSVEGHEAEDWLQAEAEFDRKAGAKD